jgi:chorismate mutase / prephenate dehydratase
MMRSTSSELADLRRQIDEIDDRMHELLIERAAIVAEVAASKTAAGAGGELAFYQPAREAQILRRVRARHRGPLPLASVLRIWRELLAATVGLETRFAVAVFAAAEAQGLWDLARDHYGSQTPMSAHASTKEVVRAVSEGCAAVGVLPVPRENERDPWWPRLLRLDGEIPRVVARLPFGARGNARPEGGDALAIGRSPPQETGRDQTLFVIESVADIRRAELRRLLTAAELSCTFIAASDHGERTATLIELDGFVRPDDPRIGCFSAGLGPGLHRLQPFGGYAVPLFAAAPLAGVAKG